MPGKTKDSSLIPLNGTDNITNSNSYSLEKYFALFPVPLCTHWTHILLFQNVTILHPPKQAVCNMFSSNSGISDTWSTKPSINSFIHSAFLSTCDIPGQCSERWNFDNAWDRQSLYQKELTFQCEEIKHTSIHTHVTPGGNTCCEGQWGWVREVQRCMARKGCVFT